MIGEIVVGVGAVVFGGCAVIAPAMFLREYSVDDDVLGGVFVVVAVAAIIAVAVGGILSAVGI
ncbi:MAG TPA: hypothetical protein PKM65_20310 [Spirochaetota bacterium]|nr:hypothetical protein [Spirochaetota bacterium]